MKVKKKPFNPHRKGKPQKSPDRNNLKQKWCNSLEIVPISACSAFQFKYMVAYLWFQPTEFSIMTVFGRSLCMGRVRHLLAYHLYNATWVKSSQLLCKVELGGKGLSMCFPLWKASRKGLCPKSQGQRWLWSQSLLPMSNWRD
jgi:hypothetical protein